MNRASIYLDYAATSPLRPEAREAWNAAIGSADFNPASAHGFGRGAHDALEEARERLALLIGAHRQEVVWTGGGTQADNLAILGYSRTNMPSRPLLVVSAIEHKAVLAAARQAEVEGAELRLLGVDRSGTVDPEELDDLLAGAVGRPCLVSVMWANNEVGTVQPVAKLCRIAHEHGALFHTDAVQALGKLPVSCEDVPADLLSLTAHKIGGPVGIGALIVRGGVELQPLIYGGSQERGLWPGTQNPLGAAAFSAAAKAAVGELRQVVPRWTELRDALDSVLDEGIGGIVVHGVGAPDRLPQLLSVGIPGADAATLLMALDLAGIAASSGSACSSGSQEGSHVLAAMGIAPGEEYAVLRFSFGPSTTEAEVMRAAEIAIRAAAQARHVRQG